MVKRYLVIGKYENRRIREEVMANSKKQAKLKAGFNNGFGGSEMLGFMKSRKVKVLSKR